MKSNKEKAQQITEEDITIAQQITKDIAIDMVIEQLDNVTNQAVKEIVELAAQVQRLSTAVEYWKNEWDKQTESRGKLQTEIEELKKDVYCVPPCNENDYEGFKWCDSHDELENKLNIEKSNNSRLRSLLNDSLEIGLGDLDYDFHTRAVIHAALDQLDKGKAL